MLGHFVATEADDRELRKHAATLASNSIIGRDWFVKNPALLTWITSLPLEPITPDIYVFGESFTQRNNRLKTKSPKATISS